MPRLGSFLSCPLSPPVCPIAICSLTTRSASTAPRCPTLTPWRHFLPASDRLALSPPKARIGATTLDFLAHTVSAEGVRPNADKATAFNERPMPVDLKQLRTLLGGLSYNRKPLPKMVRCFRSVMALLKNGAPFEFITEMKTILRSLFADVTSSSGFGVPRSGCRRRRLPPVSALL